MAWWKKSRLSFRVFFNISVLLGVTLVIGGTSVWHASRFKTMVNRLVEEDIAALQAARGMQTAIANHKGFATYFFLDGDPKWLEQLRQQRHDFQKWLEKAEGLNEKSKFSSLLDQIKEKYKYYIRKKDEVVELYKKGLREKGEKRHWEVRSLFFELNELCEQYEQATQDNIILARKTSRRCFQHASTISLALIAAALGLGLFLGIMLFTQVLSPIRRLTREASESEDELPEGDEVNTLSRRVHGLMEDMDRTRTELQQSKELLMNSEKMALVGKLATEVAHSIRNPMTSINMRLFSLDRSLDLDEAQKEDFQVVAKEMRRLDNIVRNFLEFSRPHKLRKQRLNICDIVNMSLDLLSYRIELHGVKIKWEPDESLKPVEADPELLKEVFVNLIVNACEAMEKEGQIDIIAEEAADKNTGPAIRVKVMDNGPGMSEEVRARVLEPFETTKEEGTGLGLFIVVRIIEEHGGHLELESAEGEGTAFVITLPAAGKEA